MDIVAAAMATVGVEEFELDARLELDADDPDRTVVLPIVSEMAGTRDNKGKLKHEVRVSDFVAVYLDRLESIQINDPDDPDEEIDVYVLIGKVKYRRANLSGGGATPSGVGGKTVNVAELVW